MASSHEILRLAHPIEPDRARALEAFLAHKGSPWYDDICRRVRGAVEGAEDRFFVALDGSTIVGHVWYTGSKTDRRLGTLGHVFTDPKYRRRGIATCLFRAAMADFVEWGGTTMQLFTSTSLSLPFYERHGFENVFHAQVYHDMDWYMRYPTPPDNHLQDWFRNSPVTFRHLMPGDLPQYCLLYNSEHASVSKNRAERVGSGLEAEFAFIHVSGSLAEGRAACVVMENDQTIVGAASLCCCSYPPESHVALFDIYLHRTFRQHATELTGRCLKMRTELGADMIYAMAVDASKKKLFTELGFASQGVLPSHYRIGSRRFDSELFASGQ